MLTFRSFQDTEEVKEAPDNAIESLTRLVKISGDDRHIFLTRFLPESHLSNPVSWMTLSILGFVLAPPPHWIKSVTGSSLTVKPLGGAQSEVVDVFLGAYEHHRRFHLGDVGLFGFVNFALMHA